MDHQTARQRFADRVRDHRKQRGLTQEELAELIGKTTETISFLERGERSPSFEVIVDLAAALGVTVQHLMNLDLPHDTESLVEELAVAPVAPELVPPVEVPVNTEEERKEDTERLEAAFAGIREMQKLATEYGIDDIFQDNGGKLLQVLILSGLRKTKGREGNDAVDAEGNEYELKTINLALNPNAGITTHHHLNERILAKYREVKAWIIAIYWGIELADIYRVHPSTLEPKFEEWEARIENGEILNNPKIPLALVRQGELTYSNPDVVKQLSRPAKHKKARKGLRADDLFSSDV